MKIYDLSQEIPGCDVYPGMPAPEFRKIVSMDEGAVYNLSVFSMCVHNGTHTDAPSHFFNDGKTIGRISLDHFIGPAYVAEHNGEITGEAAEDIMRTAREADEQAAQRILIKGKAVVTKEAAEVFVRAGIKLFGNESQTVGPENAPMEVHLIMLGAGIVLLEGIRLQNVPAGTGLLHAAPLNLTGAEGSPCRATLIRF